MFNIRMLICHGECLAVESSSFNIIEFVPLMLHIPRQIYYVYIYIEDLLHNQFHCDHKDESHTPIPQKRRSIGIEFILSIPKGALDCYFGTVANMSHEVNPYPSNGMFLITFKDAIIMHLLYDISCRIVLT